MLTWNSIVNIVDKDSTKNAKKTRDDLPNVISTSATEMSSLRPICMSPHQKALFWVEQKGERRGEEGKEKKSADTIGKLRTVLFLSDT